MATFAEIKEVRLNIDDPEGFIDFIEIADTASLPANPANQTAYKVTANTNYYSTTVEAGAVPSDYEILPLIVSDTRIEAWIDDKGVLYASCQALKQIIARLGKDLMLKSSTTGSEKTDFTTLTDTLEYYKSILALCEDEYNKSLGTNTGRWASTKENIIPGQGITPRTFY